jgi:capsular exopolysaccharide synthesis family protein
MITNEENLDEVVRTLRLDEKNPETDVLEKWISGILQFPKRVLSAAKNKVKALIAPAPASEAPNPPDPAEIRRREAIDRLYDALRVTPRDGGKLVNITLSSLSPHEAMQQANLLAEVYVRKNLEEKLEAATNAADWLEKQTDELAQKMYAAELSLQNFREKENFISFDVEDKDNIILERLKTLHSEYNTAHAARVDLESRLNALLELANSDIQSLNNMPPYVDRYMVDSILDLRERYIELEIRRIELSKKYKGKHPLLSTVNSQLLEIKNAIDREFEKAANTLRAEYTVLRAKEAAIEQELNEQKSQTLGLKGDMITYTALQRNAESYRTLYHETVQRLREIKLTQVSATNNAKIVKRAAVPLGPAPSAAMSKLFLSLVLSSGLGVGCAFVREYFDNRFKEAQEAELYLQLPLLGLIPHHARDKRHAYEPVLLHTPGSLVAETYRILRARIQAMTPRPKMFLITSAVPAEGKSTTAANLGIAFAQLGWNVLLVDADLRRPSLHRHFGTANTSGLATVLAEGADWQQLIRTTSLNTLKVLPAGFSTSHSSDLLSLKGMQDLVAALKQSYDLVIFDAPLIFSIPDVEILAPHMDGVLLVHCPDKCDKESVINAKNALQRIETPILGIVFNNIKKKEERYYYHQNYNYSYTIPENTKNNHFSQRNIH